MPKVFGHSACSCPVVCYILHLIQIKWINFSLCCIVYPVGFLLAIPPPFPLMFFSVKVTCLFSLFCGGSWMGCAVVPAIRGGGGGVGSFYWLAAKSESPWILQAPSLHLVMQLLTKLFLKLDVKCIK